MEDAELDLWRRYAHGDEDAREKLILHYLYLVKIQVGRISRKIPWGNKEDLTQEGVKGLITALALYDPNRGAEFAAYAQKFIRGAVFRNPEVFRDLTRYQDDNRRKVKKVHDALMRELERQPTIDEIVERSGINADQVRNALSAASIAFAQGISDQDPEALISQKTIELDDDRILIRGLLSQLSEKAAMILIEHFWNGRTDREISEKFGIKEDTVKKTRQRAISKLRMLMEAKKRM